MNKWKKLYYILMFLPIIYTTVSLFFLPDTIPAHYNGANEVDRWGSKYEILLLPLFTIPFGFFLLVMGKAASSSETNKNNNNELVTVITGLGALVVFNALCLYFLYNAFHLVRNLNDNPVDLFKMLFSILGMTLIIIGNFMPKCKMNSMVGLRTGWSMKNEKTWKVSQKFGGISFIVTGILMLVGNLFFFKGFSCMVFSMILFLGDLIASLFFTYYASKKYS